MDTVEWVRVTLTFVAGSEREARARHGDIPWLGDELVVVCDGGDVWVGPAAFLTCLWALVDWCEWSYRLSGGAFAPLAERFFRALSSTAAASPRCSTTSAPTAGARSVVGPSTSATVWRTTAGSAVVTKLLHGGDMRPG